MPDPGFHAHLERKHGGEEEKGSWERKGDEGREGRRQEGRRREQSKGEVRGKEGRERRRQRGDGE